MKARLIFLSAVVIAFALPFANIIWGERPG